MFKKSLSIYYLEMWFSLIMIKQLKQTEIKSNQTSNSQSVRYGMLPADCSKARHSLGRDGGEA